MRNFDKHTTTQKPPPSRFDYLGHARGFLKALLNTAMLQTPLVWLLGEHEQGEIDLTREMPVISGHYEKYTVSICLALSVIAF